MDNSHANANGTPGNRRKVVIIGLDGVTFDLIEPWAAAGHLPNMARLLAQGASGRLMSTIPAHSGPAWATFMTGRQPGSHGVYFFLGPSRDEQYFRPISAESIRGRRFWEVAGDQGYSVGVVNVPLTYPPRPVANGYTIGGIFAPSDATAFSPRALYDEVVAACGGYVVETDVSPDRHQYLSDMLRDMRLRQDAAEYLMTHHPTDLTVVVFRMIDSVMHYYWADMDPNHPLRAQLGDNLIPDALLNAYKLLDAAVGRLVELAGPEALVMVMSDHGFRAEYKRFAVNRWLRDNGYLHLKAGRGAMSIIGRTIKRLGLTRLAKRALVQMTGNSWQAAVWSAVDWSRTKVVYGPGPAFYVNLKGRDAHGIVTADEYDALCDRLIREFKAVRDPANGRAVVGEVYRRDAIYSGEGVAVAPDLIPEPAEYIDDGRRWGYGFEPFPGAPEIFSIAPRYAGAHANEGILIVAGPHVAPGTAEGLNIADLAPTALYGLGAAVPEALDGAVRTDLFSSTFVQENPVQYVNMAIDSTARTGQVMADDEEAKVESRLRDLGYL